MKRLPRLDLNLLQIFDAIYTKGGVSAAASHINLSQPAISHALAKLRAMLDDPLFIRQGNRLVPTGTARAVAEPIHTALRELVAALDGAGIEDIALARLGLQRRVAVRCQHAITAWQIVAKTDMLCTLPRSHVRMLQDIWPMQLFDLPIAVAQSSSYLYWHRAVQADVGLAWLRAIILEVMREE